VSVAKYANFTTENQTLVTIFKQEFYI